MTSRSTITAGVSKSEISIRQDYRIYKICRILRHDLEWRFLLRRLARHHVLRFDHRHVTTRRPSRQLQVLSKRQVRHRLRLCSSNTKSISHSIDVIEPRRNQRDLQNAAVIEANPAQSLMIFASKARSVAGELGHVVEHRSFLLSDVSSFVIRLQRANQILI